MSKDGAINQLAISILLILTCQLKTMIVMLNFTVGSLEDILFTPSGT